VALAGRVLAPCRAALPPEVLSCRRHATRRQPWQQMYISQIFWFVHLFFENQRRKYILKKF
jgi:hypothetical protein